MDASDPYATAKANLRDNVKTLATILAGVAGVVLAGAPFSGLGSLDPWTSRFNGAVAGLAVAAFSLFIAWRWLIFTLRPDVNYAGVLRDNFTDADVDSLRVDRREKREIRYLRREFHAHRAELLPERIASVEALEKYVSDEWDALVAKGATADKSNWERYYNNLDNIAYWATFIRLQYRVRQGINVGQWFGVIGIVGLFAFAWAANPKKDDAGKQVLIHVDACASCPAPRPPDAPISRSHRIEFETNEATLTGPAFTVLRAVAADLRAQPGAGILLLAHTDTVASDRINRALAARRAEAVYSALIGQGGIAANRVFMSALPKMDLPVLTDREIARPENRSVELLIVNLPIPAR